MRPQKLLNSAAIYSAFSFHGGQRALRHGRTGLAVTAGGRPGRRLGAAPEWAAGWFLLRHRPSAVVVMQSADATCCWRLARSTCGRWAAFQEAVVVEHCSPAAFQTARAQGGFCRAAWAPFSVCPLAGALAASAAFRTKVRPSLPSWPLPHIPDVARPQPRPYFALCRAQSRPRRGAPGAFRLSCCTVFRGPHASSLCPACM